MLRDVLGFAEHQEKASYGLGYKLTLTRNSNSAVLSKDNAVNNAKIKINSIEWYIPHYTPSIPQQTMLSNQILSKLPTELQYVERSVYMKEVNTQKIWSFELGTEEGIILQYGSLWAFNKEIDRIHKIQTMILFTDHQ